MRGHDLVGVLDLAMRGNRHRLRHLHDEIRLRNVPAVSPLAWRRCVLLDLPPARPHPPMPRSLRSAASVSDGSFAKCPISRIGKPRRHHLHLARGCAMADAHGLRLLIRHERHRRNFVRHDGSSGSDPEESAGIFVESWRGAGCFSAAPSRACQADDNSKRHAPAIAIAICVHQRGFSLFNLAASSARSGVSMAAINATVISLCLHPIPGSSAPANRNPSTALRSGSCGRPGVTCRSIARFASNIRCWKSARSPHWPLK